MITVESRGLEALFKPNSVAIVGASPDETKFGGRPIKYMLDNRFNGTIFPVNPKYDEIAGLDCYPTITDIPGDIDVAIVALPQKMVLDTLKQCASKGVRSVVIFSAGFAETGDSGSEQQQEITRIAKENNMRILGPNCLGAFNVKSGFYGTFSTILTEGVPYEGHIGFVSQSGAFGSHVYTLAKQRKIGLNYFVATGNESDVDVADCIAYLAEDDDTRVIACYIEGVKDGEKLMHAFKLANQNNKPVVMLKVGSTEVGMKAAMSHTASLTGEDQVFDVIFNQFNVYRARTIDEFLDVADACTKLPKLNGDRVALFTVSGGIGILMADQLDENGLVLPETPDYVQKNLLEMLPIAGVKNPIDTTAQIGANPKLLEEFMDRVLASGEYDSAIAFLAFAGLSPNTLDDRLEVLTNIQKKYPEIPLVTVSLMNDQSRQKFIERNLIVIDDPTRAVKVIGALNKISQIEETEEQISTPIVNDIKLPNQSVLNEYDAKLVLGNVGLPITKEIRTKSKEEAVAFGEQIGFPIVMKGISPQILHKTDSGLVRLHVSSKEEIERTFDELKTIIDSHVDAEFEGILIQEMIVDESIEMYVGSKKDPTFGQMVLVGLGGIYIEVLKDVSMRKAPICEETALEMLKELKGYQLLEGYRGQKQYDLDSLKKVISRFSQFIAAHEDILEVDLNPVLVHENGNGAKIVDSLMKIDIK